MEEAEKGRKRGSRGSRREGLRNPREEDKEDRKQERRRDRESKRKSGRRRKEEERRKCRGRRTEEGLWFLQLPACLASSQRALFLCGSGLLAFSCVYMGPLASGKCSALIFSVWSESDPPSAQWITSASLQVDKA